MLVADPAQFEPMQQMLGCEEDCGVQVRPGAHPPAESQRQPCVPTMQVDVMLPLLEAEAVPLVVVPPVVPPDEAAEPLDDPELLESSELVPPPLAVLEVPPEPLAAPCGDVPQADAASHTVT
jgi:hypothetical protein